MDKIYCCIFMLLLSTTEAFSCSELTIECDNKEPVTLISSPRAPRKSPVRYSSTQFGEDFFKDTKYYFEPIIHIQIQRSSQLILAPLKEEPIVIEVLTAIEDPKNQCCVIF